MEFEKLFDRAEIIRKIFLDFEFDPRMVRAVLVASAEKEAEKRRAAGEGGESAVWERLVGPWPGSDVRRRLSSALEREETIRNAVSAADEAMLGRKPIEALRTLAAALRSVDSIRLKSKLGAIFSNSEAEYLQIIGICGAASPESVIGLALLAVEELRILEQAADREPAICKSEAKLQELTVRLNAHWLGNRLIEVQRVYVKLKDVDGLPNSDGTPQMDRDWSQWIVSGDWSKHEIVVNDARVHGLDTLNDISALDRNYRLYSRLAVELNHRILKLRLAFRDENYEEALNILALLGSPTDVGGRDVLAALDSKITVLDTYSGRTMVSELAQRLKDELISWEQWKEQCTTVHSAADTAWQQVQAMVAIAKTLNAKRQTYADFVQANPFPDNLREDPPITGNPVAQDSKIRRVQKLSEEGRSCLMSFQNWVNEAERKVLQFTQEINAKGGFPSADSFQRGVNALKLNSASPDFKALLDRAETIGPANQEEVSRCRHFRNVYITMTQRKRKWWELLFGSR